MTKIMSFNIIYSTFYLRDTKKYPIGLRESGEDVNPEPGKCNNFNNRFKKTGPNKADKQYGEAFPIYIMQHHTVGNFQSTAAIFSKNDSYVSSHYVIDTNGEVYRFVGDVYRAYHAGRGSFAERSCLSSLSICELQNDMNSWSFGAIHCFIYSINCMGLKLHEYMVVILYSMVAAAAFRPQSYFCGNFRKCIRLPGHHTNVHPHPTT